MKLNSSLFDKIRIKSPAAEKAAEQAAKENLCEHAGCKKIGEFRAPKGRGREGQFFKFCAEHIKAYNATYNYFAGMSDGAVADYQKDAHTGHRPTWKLGVNSKTVRVAERNARRGADVTTNDPFSLFGDGTGQSGKVSEPQAPVISEAARKAYLTLDLPETSEPAAVKARYKLLVKRFHPDANGGDRSREERLQEIIRAYNYLKAVKRA
jgi:hypothetical protein